MTIYEGHGVTLHHADCLDVLRSLSDASVDSVVTDPPYGLEFMGKEWDKFDKPTKGRADLTDHTNFTPKKSKFKNGVGTQVGMPKKNPRCRVCSRLKFDKPASKCSCQSPDWDTRTRENAQAFGDWCEAWATECLRVLKPGGHLLAFGGTRTWHRLACAVEDAGFEVRDSIAWLYGSGFPKSLDVSKAIDKAAGVLEHEGRGFTVAGRTDKNLPNPVVKGYVPPAPATPDAERWQGWGTALKPAFEPVVVARKPLVGTVAANVLAHGTGALNIDGCRIEHGGNIANADGGGQGAGYEAHNKPARIYGKGLGGIVAEPHTSGRWPANVVLDESQAVAIDEQSGDTTRYFQAPRQGDGKSIDGSVFGQHAGDGIGYNDTGGASRYFYVAKADASERPRVNGTAHPTVKPLALMRWLVRLVTPPGGTVLEPFAGSGTTVEACIVEGFQCIAIEREADYLPLIRQRIDRRRDPVEALRGQAADLGLFDLLGGEAS